MKKVLIYLMRFGLQMIYAVLKLLPTKKNKVVFLSRQSDTLTPDFEMVHQELRREDPQIEIVTICHRLEGAGSGGLKGILSFAGSTVRSMYHMATASVCVLDAYWPAVSLFFVFFFWVFLFFLVFFFFLLFFFFIFFIFFFFIHFLFFK